MLSSHVKISPLLRLQIKLHLLQQKLEGLLFIGVYIINRILYSRLEILNFSSRVKSLRSLMKYCSTLMRNFVPLRGHVYPLWHSHSPLLVPSASCLPPPCDHPESESILSDAYLPSPWLVHHNVALTLTEETITKFRSAFLWLYTHCFKNS